MHFQPGARESQNHIKNLENDDAKIVNRHENSSHNMSKS